ncbi:hypothetical protein VWM83_09500, partial [Campylobacter coli]
CNFDSEVKKCEFFDDEEGRVLEHRFKNIALFNIYFPNGQKDEVNILVSMKLNLPNLKNFLINTENFPLLLVGFCQEFVSIFPCP